MERQYQSKLRPEIRKEHLHKGLQRKQIFLPDIKSDMCTLEYLLKVIRGQVHYWYIYDMQMRYICEPVSLNSVTPASQL